MSIFIGSNIVCQSFAVLDDRCAGTSEETNDWPQDRTVAPGLLRYETDTDTWVYYKNDEEKWQPLSVGGGELPSTISCERLLCGSFIELDGGNVVVDDYYFTGGYRRLPSVNGVFPGNGALYLYNTTSGIVTDDDPSTWSAIYLNWNSLDGKEFTPPLYKDKTIVTIQNADRSTTWSYTLDTDIPETTNTSVPKLYINYTSTEGTGNSIKENDLLYVTITNAIETDSGTLNLTDTSATHNINGTLSSYRLIARSGGILIDTPSGDPPYLLKLIGEPLTQSDGTKLDKGLILRQRYYDKDTTAVDPGYDTDTAVEDRAFYGYKLFFEFILNSGDPYGSGYVTGDGFYDRFLSPMKQSWIDNGNTFTNSNLICETATVDGGADIGVLTIKSGQVFGPDGEGKQSRIIFAYGDNTQDVQLRHNIYDSEEDIGDPVEGVAPFGLRIEKAPGNNQLANSAYLSVEGNIIVGDGVIIGGATIKSSNSNGQASVGLRIESLPNEDGPPLFADLSVQGDITAGDSVIAGDFIVSSTPDGFVIGNRTQVNDGTASYVITSTENATTLNAPTGAFLNFARGDNIMGGFFNLNSSDLFLYGGLNVQYDGSVTPSTFVEDAGTKLDAMQDYTDLESVFPDCITEEQGSKFVSQQHMNLLLLSAIKELRAENLLLKATLTDVVSKFNALTED